ncbi:MAG: SDR family oxidoreductase [Rhizobiales bacterium]|nr:SDR family oxidoreductase [Hyphomicrobiales bacterium]
MLTTDKFRLDGKVAIVTGSGRNIGRAVAEAYALAGARVVVNGQRDRNAVDAVVERIRDRGGDAIGIMADVSRHQEVEALVRRVAETFGSVDIVVSNVGIRRYQSFFDITVEDWDNVIRTNLSASFFLARYAIPFMQAKRWGRFIVISGYDGFWSQVTHRAHNIAAKAGLHGFAKALGREFGADGITANTVSPGSIDTERDWSQYPHQTRERLEKEIPLGRFGHVDEVAGTCLFLASDAGGFVSGQVVHVNGGHYMY